MGFTQLFLHSWVPQLQYHLYPHLGPPSHPALSDLVSTLVSPPHVLGPWMAGEL